MLKTNREEPSPLLSLSSRTGLAESVTANAAVSSNRKRVAQELGWLPGSKRLVANPEISPPPSLNKAR